MAWINTRQYLYQTRKSVLLPPLLKTKSSWCQLCHYNLSCCQWKVGITTTFHFSRYPCMFRTYSRLVPSQWEMSLQSNAVSYWLGANLESALHVHMFLLWFVFVYITILYGFLWSICRYSSGPFHWHHMISPVPVNSSWRTWVKLPGTKSQQSMCA